MTTASTRKLTFQPYSSILNPGFWQQLTNVKLNQLKLSEEPLDIHGSYSCNLDRNLPCLASFDHNSFTPCESWAKSTCSMYGKIICMNLLQEFIDLDKKSFLNAIGSEIWDSINSGAALQDPEKCLSRFGLLVFADLKKYNFFYWFSFPALNYLTGVFHIDSAHGAESRPASILDDFTQDAIKTLQRQYDLPSNQRTFQRGYFMVILDTISKQMECMPLTRYYEMSSNLENREIYFAFTDPSPDTAYPGWPLRNFLTLIAVQYKLKRVKIIRIRRGLSTNVNNLDFKQSMILDLCLELPEDHPSIHDCPPVSGWEKNESQHLAPKRVNLSSLLDPKRLAEDAVNLNLRLMKWRLLPGLDLERIANTKCLLLGCGTLGCHIARGLLSWGVKHISLVDNSKISYSNPVRQSLYTFEDCTSQKGGVYKAEAAAISLKKIHPTVNVQAHVFSIPMPGHHIAQNELEQTEKDVAKLDKLIKEHDAIFLLMDTRESRWLPSVIGLANKRLIINSAIGFDTFLLQRYGIRDYFLPPMEPSDVEVRHNDISSGVEHKRAQYLDCTKLGCYFCNDIVAPGDSTLDRTLDQQCTVTRPGVSMMVSALAVELFASVMSSSQGSSTPAPVDLSIDQLTNYEDESGSELGLVPHTIRGNLNRFHIYMPTSPVFNKCSACSFAVVRSYIEQGFEFLHKIFNDPNHLEEVAGLKDLQNVNDDVWALDSDETIFDDSV